MSALVIIVAVIRAEGKHSTLAHLLLFAYGGTLLKEMILLCILWHARAFLINYISPQLICIRLTNSGHATAESLGNILLCKWYTIA